MLLVHFDDDDDDYDCDDIYIYIYIYKTNIIYKTTKNILVRLFRVSHILGSVTATSVAAVVAL